MSCRTNTERHKTLIRSFFTLITTHCSMCVINDKGDLVETNCLLVYLFILIDRLKCKENGEKCKASNSCFYFLSQKLPEKRFLFRKCGKIFSYWWQICPKLIFIYDDCHSLLVYRSTINCNNHCYIFLAFWYTAT